MTTNEIRLLQQRYRDVCRYMYGISPKLSKFAELDRERKTIKATLDANGANSNLPYPERLTRNDKKNAKISHIR